jgi:hypothetical protein
LKENKDLHKAMAVMFRPIVKTKKEYYEIERYQGSNTYAEVMKSAPLNVVVTKLLTAGHSDALVIKSKGTVILCSLLRYCFPGYEIYYSKQIYYGKIYNYGIGENQYTRNVWVVKRI